MKTTRMLGCTSLLALAVGCTAARSQVTTTKDEAAPQTLQAKAQVESWTSPARDFELDRPASEEWALATDLESPEGRAIPLVVAHTGCGAQIVVQVSEPIDRPEAVAKMLRSKLADEKALKLSEAKALEVDSGAEAYGFDFAVDGEAKGRVAIIEVGEQMVLVVASWPEGADKSVVKDIDGVVKSVRMPVDAMPTMLRPDKA